MNSPLIVHGVSNTMNSNKTPGHIKMTKPLSAAPKGQRPPKSVRTVSPKPSPVPGPRMAYDSTRAAAKRETRRLNPRTQLLVGSMTLPKEIEPIRIGTAFGSDETAVARLFRKVNIKSAGTGAGSVLPKTNVAAFAFRDPLRSFIHTVGMTPNDYWDYASEGAVFATVLGTTAYVRYFGPLEYTGLGTILPHGESLYPGRLGPSDPHRGFLVNVGDRFRIQISARPAVTTAAVYRVILMQLEGTVWSEAPVSPGVISQTTGGTVDYLPTELGYYSWALSTEFNAASGVGLAVIDNSCVVSVAHLAGSGNMSSMWAQLSLPRISESIDSIKSFRISAVSLMLTNTASPLNRQGQVCGLQLPKQTHWYDYTDYEELASASKSHTINVVNGMYGFLKPTSPSDMDMDTCVFPVDETETEYVFSLFPRTDYLCIQANITNVDGLQGYFTPCHHIEFETLSQWYSLDLSKLGKDELDNALRVVARLPQWHENDLHFSDIWNGIKSFASDVWSGIKEVGSAMVPFAPLLPLLL